MVHSSTSCPFIDEPCEISIERQHCKFSDKMITKLSQKTLALSLMNYVKLVLEYTIWFFIHMEIKIENKIKTAGSKRMITGSFIDLLPLFHWWTTWNQYWKATLQTLLKWSWGSLEKCFFYSHGNIQDC